MHKLNLYVIGFIIFCITLTGCDLVDKKHSRFEKTVDGIIVKLNQAERGKVKTIRLQVVSDDIIHVTATPKDRLAEIKGLIATYHETKKEGWDIVESDNGTITLKTASIHAVISSETGEITYKDPQGQVILQEFKGGGKFFRNIVTDGVLAYSIRQIFESPDDEAFYGLGQHQSDEFNYKGKDESLYQYNTKVSVPFIVSNKNYGILWDNYSLTKFGDPRDYSQISKIFKLFDKDGYRGGLTATYQVAGKDSDKVSVQRAEETIDYENLETIQKLPEGFPLKYSTVSWEGFFEPGESGVFKFNLLYAGYAKLYLDDELIVPERWRTAWNPNNHKFSIDMKAGQRYKLRLEWKPDGNVSFIGLKALNPVDPARQNQLSFWSEMGKQLDYYFIRGRSMDNVIAGYRTVTGKAQVMPKWAMGFWQSRERYKTQNELVGVLKEFRTRQIPIDNIVQDWSYWPENAWGSHDFEPKRYPNPHRMIDEVHSLNARFMISVWPKFYCTTENYKQFDAGGWMYKRAVQDSVHDWIGTGYIGSFYDAYSDKARDLFWSQLNEKLYNKGVDAWWMDASEPDILSNTDINYRKALMNPTAAGSSTEYFNTYGLMNSKGIYEGQRETNPDSRVFQLTRSGFAGSQKYAAAIWSGDIGARWEDMKAQITAGLNFSISGNPYWTMDNGGFCVEKRYEIAMKGTDSDTPDISSDNNHTSKNPQPGKKTNKSTSNTKAKKTKAVNSSIIKTNESEDLKEWRELNVRWHQFGAFAPLFRTHGQFPYREIWNIAPEKHPAYDAMLYYTQLRYQLMPYIYTLAGKAYFDDYTIMRPLVMDFPADTAILNIGDQYMFGPSLMVCPVYTYNARRREVYLPGDNEWYDLYSGKSIPGGNKYIVYAPYDRIPVFVPSGAIIPMGELIQHTQTPQIDLTLLVYEGKDGSFTLYEDEGVNYNYEKGDYSSIPFEYDDEGKLLTIGGRIGEFTGMIKERKFRIIYVTKKNDIGIDNKSNNNKTIVYDGTEQVIRLD